MSLQTHPNRFFSKFCYILQVFLTFGLLMFFTVEKGGPSVFPSFSLGETVAHYYPHGIPTSGKCDLFGEEINCTSLRTNQCLKENDCFKSSDPIIEKAIEEQPAGIAYENNTTFGILVASSFFVISFLVLFVVWVAMYFNEFRCIYRSRWIPDGIVQVFTGNYWRNEVNFHKVYLFFATLVFLTSITGLVWFSADWNQDYHITSNRNVESSYFNGDSNCKNNLFINMAKTNTPHYSPNNTYCYEIKDDRICCLNEIVKLNDDALQLAPMFKHHRMQFEVAWPLGLFFASFATYLFQLLTFYCGYRIDITYEELTRIDLIDTGYYNNW